MDKSNETENKVVSLFDRTARASTSPASTKAQDNPSDFDFEAIRKRNAENSSRQQQDREKANKGVIRSYRLKH